MNRKSGCLITRIAVVLVSLGFTLLAVAQKPTITETPFTTLTISGGPANGACNFDVLVTPQQGRPNLAKVIQFANKAIFTGPVFLTLTNLSTQKTVNVNSSSSSILTFSGGIPTTQTFSGPTLGFGLSPSQTAEAGLPAVFLAKGRITFTFDTQGEIISVTFNGTSEDICPMLE